MKINEFKIPGWINLIHMMGTIGLSLMIYLGSREDSHRSSISEKELIYSYEKGKYKEMSSGKEKIANFMQASDYLADMNPHSLVLLEQELQQLADEWAHYLRGLDRMEAELNALGKPFEHHTFHQPDFRHWWKKYILEAEQNHTRNRSLAETADRLNRFLPNVWQIDSTLLWLTVDEDVHLRRQPSRLSAIDGTALAGDTVFWLAVDRRQHWRHIRLMTGTEGWVESSIVSEMWK